MSARINDELAPTYEQLKADRDAQQKRADALLAEGAVMLKLLTDISDNHVEYFSEGECGMFAGVPLDYVSEINMYVSRDVNAENPFPATDAALAAIEARGVEKAAVKMQESGAQTFGDCYIALVQYANELREAK